MAILQLHHCCVNPSPGVGHHHLPPGFPLVVRNPEGGGVPCQAVHGVGADPGSVNPSSVFQDLDGLPGEGALLRENGFVVGPGLAAVKGFLAADLRGKLHIVLSRHPAQLGGIHAPYGAVGAQEQRGVLLGTGGIIGNIHRLLPLVRPLGQPGADDVNVRVSLKRTGKPAAQQVAVGQLHHSGAMAGAPGAGGNDGFHGAHFFVLVDLAVQGQAGQSGIFHKFLPPFYRSYWEQTG